MKKIVIVDGGPRKSMNTAQLLQRFAEGAKSVGENSSDTLLLKAFEKGELSLLKYLLEMEYFYERFQKRAAAERDLARLLAELTAYTL